MNKKINFKNLKKTIIISSIIIILVLIIILIIIGIKNSEPFKEKLVDMGYTYNQAEKIETKISSQNQEIILQTEKNDTILNIIISKNYKDKNLSKYISYYEKNTKAPAEDIITIINSNYDLANTKYNSLTAKLVKEKYFIFDNLNRYLDYQKNNKNLKIKEIISEVNSHLDKTKYIDTKETNTKEKNVMLVNKYYFLTEDYEPTDLVTLSNTYNTGTNNRLRRDAANAFIKMADAALLDNIVLKNASGYRDYKYQVTLYNNYVNRDGKQAADTYSARPGFSEHQTGLATDINTIDNSFENTDEFKWLSKNAHKYGFILRFPKDKEKITGYEYEPWHYRYVGKSVASQIKEENLTLEEYYAFYIENKTE